MGESAVSASKLCFIQKGGYKKMDTLSYIMHHPGLILLIYLVIINLFGFIQMGIDKAKAKHGSRRISERALFLTAIIGGSIGSLLGMNVFRHKTKHWYFTVGMPVILVLQILLFLIFGTPLGSLIFKK